MAANLSLVVGAAEAEADEFAPGGRAMLWPSEGIADPGRPDKARIGLRPCGLSL